jgi:hypothetical protein
MKKAKVVALVILAIFGIVNSYAQEIELGAKAGINISSISGDSSVNTGSLGRLNFGFMAEYHINEKFSFQPELLYSQQGYVFFENTIALDYLNVPLLGKYYVTKGLSLEAGPQIGFLLSADVEGEDVKDAFQSLDYGVTAGLGYKLDNGINFSARYYLGLANINDLPGIDQTSKNGVFQLSVGYFFF